MVPCIFYILFFPFLLLSVDGFEANCSTVKCSYDGPDIHFPFRVLDRQPEHCGRSGFKLVCKENTTMIHFPTYGDLVVESISHDGKKLNLLDPKNCVHEVFLNLNLSLTPFRYYYVVKNYIYLNCSTRLLPPFIEVPCLSGSSHHVYTIESSLDAPVSCRPVKTVAIPFAYSPYLADNSFGLGLTWSLPGCEDCEAKGGQCGFLSKAELQTGCLNNAQDKGLTNNNLLLDETYSNLFKVLFCIIAVITLLGMKIYYSKKLHCHLENEKLLEVPRDYEVNP